MRACSTGLWMLRTDAGARTRSGRARRRCRARRSCAVRGTSSRSARKALGDDATDSQLHEVRIRTKRARYAAEAAAPVVGKQARAFAHAAARLQDVLGELNDSVVAGAWLSAWAEQNGDASAAGAAEALAAGERSTAAELRGRWRTAWEELADPKLRVWM